MMNTREKKITIPYQHKENVYITKKKKKKYSRVYFIDRSYPDFKRRFILSDNK